MRKRGKQPIGWLLRSNWLLIVAIIAVVLAFCGLWGLPPEEKPILVEMPYAIAQIFMMNSGISKPFDSIPLILARLLVAILFLYASCSVFKFAAKKCYRALRKPNGHTLILSAGYLGLEIARQSRTRFPDDPIALVDSSDKILEEAKKEIPGIFTHQGEVVDTQILREFRLHKARRVVIAMESEVDVLAAAAVVGDALRGDDSTIQAKVECHIQIHRLCQEIAFSKCGTFRNLTEHMVAAPFNPCANAARLVLRNNPLDGFDGINACDETRAVLVISGCGAMGEALLLYAVRTSHYANHSRLKIIVFDPAEDRERDILFRYPALRDIKADIDFHKYRLEDSRSLRILEEMAKDSSIKLTIALCLRDASRALEQALHLPQSVMDKAMQILIRLDRKEWGDFLERRGNPPESPDTGHGKYRVFGTLEEMASIYETDAFEKFAEFIHERYREESKKAGTLTLEMNKPFRDLDFDVRQSNILQAEHASVKLRALGYAIQADTSEEKEAVLPAEEEVQAMKEILAEAEHNRWWAERLLAGWRAGPKKGKITPHLIPYKDLAESVKKHDRNALENILEFARQKHFSLKKLEEK